MYKLMDRRKEPRFQVYASAKVAPLDDPESEIEGRLIDISGLGLRLIADVEFREDQIITVETDQHLILADVRNCMPRGTKFGIGAERVHSAAKISLPNSVSKAERNHALVEAYHQRLKEELPSPAEAVATVRVPVEQRVVLPAPQPTITEMTEQLQMQPPTAVAAMVAEPEPEPATAEAVSTALSPKKPEDVRLDSLQYLPFARKPQTMPSQLSPVHDEAESEPDAPKAVPEPQILSTPPSDVRMLLGTPFEREDVPSRRKKTLVAAACAALALLVILLGPFAKRILFQTSVAASTPKIAASSAPSAPVPAAPAQVAVAPAPVASAPVPETQPAAETKPPAPEKSTLTISSTDKSWITACGDGKVVFTKVFDHGSQEDLSFTETALVRVGRAGPVQIRLNGKSIGPLGAAGQIRVVQFTPDSWRFLKLHDADGCTQ